MFLVIELEIVFYLFEFCAGAHTILNNKKSLDMNQDLFAKLVTRRGSRFFQWLTESKDINIFILCIDLVILIIIYEY